MINEQQNQAIAVLNRLHGQGQNAGYLLTDEEYFMLMEYVLQEKQQCSLLPTNRSLSLQSISNCATDGRSEEGTTMVKILGEFSIDELIEHVKVSGSLTEEDREYIDVRDVRLIIDTWLLHRQINSDPCVDCDHKVKNCHSSPCYAKKAFDEQRSAWSEEDKRMIETIIGHLERQKNYQINTTNIEQCQDWLKSIKDGN